MDARIECWDAEMAGRRARDVAVVYGEAFAGPPYHRTAGHAGEFLTAFRTQIGRSGFAFRAAEDGDGRLLGIAYGYTGGPGQWWTDSVAAQMPAAERTRWLSGHFELVELAVHPEARGLGLGRALHDCLLAGLLHPTACLSTIAVETVALAMYRRSGWQTLISPFAFPGISQPYIIMGLELPARRGATC